MRNKRITPSTSELLPVTFVSLTHTLPKASPTRQNLARRITRSEHASAARCTLTSLNSMRVARGNQIKLRAAHGSNLGHSRHVSRLPPDSTAVPCGARLAGTRKFTYTTPAHTISCRYRATRGEWVISRVELSDQADFVAAGCFLLDRVYFAASGTRKRFSLDWWEEKLTFVGSRRF